MDMNKDLHEVCETLSRAVSAANEKIRGAGGKLSASDAEYVDRLLHGLKSAKAVIKMQEESEMDDGYSERGYSRDGYSRRYSYEGSYGPGRGRGSNARRDSMGRYSSNYGYSGGNDMVEELRSLMQDAPDDQTRQEMQRLIEKMERR